MIGAYIMHLFGIGIDVMRLDPHVKYHFLATGAYVLVAGILLVGIAGDIVRRSTGWMMRPLALSAIVLLVVNVILTASVVAIQR